MNRRHNDKRVVHPVELKAVARVLLNADNEAAALITVKLFFSTSLHHLLGIREDNSRHHGGGGVIIINDHLELD